MENSRAADHAEADHNGDKQPAKKPQQCTPHAATIGLRRGAAIVVSPVSSAGFYLQNIGGQLGQLGALALLQFDMRRNRVLPKLADDVVEPVR